MADGEMKLISFVSFKGGAGKSTALMAIASALVAQGEKIALLEADENQPLARWRQNAKEIDTWDETRCLVLSSNTEAELFASFEAAQESGCTFALADTAGGGSQINTTIMTNSQAIILPTSLSVIDLDEALNTYEFIVGRLFPEISEPIYTRLLLTRFPQSRLKAPERANLEAINEMPQFKTHLTERSAFADLKATGLLHLYQQKLGSIPAKRLMAGHIRAAFSEVNTITGELLEGI